MKFRSIEDNVTLNTVILLFAEIFVFVFVGTNYLWNWLSEFPDWLEIAIIGLSLVFIFFEVVGYRQAKQVAKNFTLFIEDDALGFTFGGPTKRIPWSDIKLEGFKKKSGRIYSIKIRTRFNQKITIKGMEEMGRIVELIKEKTESNTAQ